MLHVCCMKNNGIYITKGGTITKGGNVAQEGNVAKYGNMAIDQYQCDVTKTKRRRWMNEAQWV